MDNLNVVREAIRNATTLDDLLIVLNETVPILNEDEREILAAEFCDLPLYSNDYPTDTREVWSWDSGRKIVGSSLPFSIVARGSE
jgi:hypothetical protein